MDDFKELVELYSHDLSRLCYKLCGNPYDAEDLFQDTWARAMDKYEKYDRTKSFRSWLFAVCVNIYKSSGRLRYNTARAFFSTADENDRVINSVPDNERDIDSSIDLRDAISSLPKKHRVVITLYYFRDLSRSEIAEILGVPEGTVSSRLDTAKKQLRRRLYHE